MIVPVVRKWTAGTSVDAELLNELGDALRFLRQPPECALRQTVGQPVSIGAYTVMSYQTVNVDTDGMFSISQPDRITINTSGWYEIEIATNWAAATDTTLRMQAVYINGVRMTYSDMVNDGIGNLRDQLSFDYFLNAGDYIDHRVSTSAATATAGSLISNPEFETDTSGWIQGSGTDTALARSTAVARTGAASLAVTKPTAGSSKASTLYAVGSGITVYPGETYNVSAYSRAATTGRSSFVRLDWYTAAGASAGTSAGTATANNATGWTLHSASGVAPPTAAYVSVSLISTSLAAGETHYWDSVSLSSSASAWADSSFRVRWSSK